MTACWRAAMTSCCAAAAAVLPPPFSAQSESKHQNGGGGGVSIHGNAPVGARMGNFLRRFLPKPTPVGIVSLTGVGYSSRLKALTI